MPGGSVGRTILAVLAGYAANAALVSMLTPHANDCRLSLSCRPFTTLLNDHSTGNLLG